MIKKIIGIVLIFALLWTIVSSINKENSTKRDSKNLEQAAQINFKRPSFTLTGLDKKRYSTEKMKKPLVINFWASWCGPCRIEAPELVNLYKKYDHKVEIYAVNITANDTEVGARSFAEEFNFNFPVLLDKDGKVSQLYKVTAIPTTYFISSDGIIVDRITGFGGKGALETKFKNLIKAEE